VKELVEKFEKKIRKDKIRRVQIRGRKRCCIQRQKSLKEVNY